MSMICKRGADAERMRSKNFGGGADAELKNDTLSICGRHPSELLTA